MKYLLTVLLFILLKSSYYTLLKEEICFTSILFDDINHQNTEILAQSFHNNSNFLQSTRTHRNRSDSISLAQNEFHRILLEHIISEYRHTLDIYFRFWNSSRQMINRQLIDDITAMTTITTSRDGQNYTTTIGLLYSDIQRIIQNRNDNPAISQHYQRFLLNGDIDQLLNAIDLSLMAPNPATLIMLNDLARLVGRFEIDFPSRLILVDEDRLNIPFRFNFDGNHQIDFYMNDIKVSSLSSSTNLLNLDIVFNGIIPHQNTIIIQRLRDQNQTHHISFQYDILSSISTRLFVHDLFFNDVIRTHFPDASGEIAILHIASPRFLVATENFPPVINAVKLVLHEKGWAVGNEYDSNHIIVVNKAICDERRLNIGTYYVRAFLEMTIYDSMGIEIRFSRTQNIEAIDMNSFRQSHDRVDRQLLNIVDTLF